MSAELLHAILRERDRRQARRQSSDVRLQLAPIQLEPFESQRSRSKALLAGRGAGKSSVCAAKAVDTIQKRRRPWILLASLTREQARRTLFEPLRGMAAAVGLRIPDPDVQGRVKLPDGGIVYLSGADTLRDIRRYRGTAWDLAIVDEAGELPDHYLYQLVYDVIEPRLMDKPWSEMWVCGTPGHALVGTWFNITGPREEGGQSQPGWDVYFWDARQNPFVDAAKYFSEILQKRAWDESHPTFVREYLGKWVTDATRLICRLPESSIVDELPDPTPYTRVLSLDFGVVDECASTVLWFSPTIPWPIAVHSWEQAGLAPSDASAIIAQQIIDHRIDYAVGDSGGIGRAFIAEYARRHQLPIQAVQKDDKAANLRLFADDVATRMRFLRGACDPLVTEIRRVIWDERRQDVQEGLKDHRFHSCYYGWRYLYPRLSRLPEPPPPPAKTLPQELQERLERAQEQRLRPRSRGLDEWAVD